MGHTSGALRSRNSASSAPGPASGRQSAQKAPRWWVERLTYLGTKDNRTSQAVLGGTRRLRVKRHRGSRDTQDSTRYGLSRSSPRTFLAHHRAAISAAVVLADATTILLAAPMSFKLTMWPKMIVGLSTPLF